MKLKNINIPIYDFSLILVEIENKDDADAVEKQLSRVKVPNDEVESVKDYISKESKNGGNTYTNSDLKKILVMLYPCESDRERRNVINHEKRHVVDRIMQWASVDDIEAAAFLDGFISEFMY
jgi:hypothetical protein